MELLTVPQSQRIALLEAALPADPEHLWALGPDVTRLAHAWNELQGPRTPVDETLLADLGETMGFPTDILRTYTAPRPGDWLHTDGVSVSEGQWITTTARSGTVPFSDRQLPSAANGLAWLAYHLPAGHPLRANLPLAYALIRQRLRSPTLLIGSVALAEDNAISVRLPAVVEGARADSVRRWHHVCPALLTAGSDPALDVIPAPNAASIRLMLEPAFERMIASLDTVELPAGGCQQDPMSSVPELVARIGAALAIDPPAASLYLQLLALPDPTDKLVARWTGRDHASLAEAGRTLLDRGLVIRSEHDNAGRTLFLPGPWYTHRFVPDFEAWKAPLYGFAATEDPPFHWTLVARPVIELFHDAVDRVLAGDVPR